MKVDSAAARILQNSQQMMQILQQAQQSNQDLGNKMIKMSVEQKVARNKNQLVGALVDSYA